MPTDLGIPSLSRAVLVDLDDTLFDHRGTCREAIAALRRSRPFLGERSLPELWREYLQLLEDVWPDVLRGGLTVEQARRERWRRLALSCGRALTAEEAQELSKEYRAEYQRLRRPVPGAVALVRHLSSEVPVVVVSNNETAEQEEKVRFLGIDRFLTGLIVSEAVGVAKPDPRIFRVALSAAGVPAEQAVMVGDSWPNDVLGARAAGIRAVWFNRRRMSLPEGGCVEQLRSFRPLAATARTLLRPAAAPSRAL